MSNQSQDELRSLLKALGYSEHKRDLVQLGKYLGKLAGREPYTYTYLVSVLRGHKFKPGLRFKRAMAAGLAISDGTHPTLASAHEVTVFALIPEVSYALIHTEVRYCRNCQTRFVPNAWNRQYCYLCRPAKRIA